SGHAGPGQTSDERRAGLDKRLDDSLGSFDAGLRTEQQRVAQERDTRRAAAAGSAAAEGQGADKSADKSADTSGSAGTEVPAPDDKPSGTHRRGDASRRRDTSGDLKSEKASKKPDDNAGNGASAREIPDGSDDDVVARRLRQAAEQETDPELKEKLWQEYIDYKRNAQGKGERTAVRAGTYGARARRKLATRDAVGARRRGLRGAGGGRRLRHERIQAAAQGQPHPGGSTDPAGRAARRRGAPPRPGHTAEPRSEGARQAAHQPRYPQGGVALRRNTAAQHARDLGPMGRGTRSPRERAVHRRDRLGEDRRVDRREARARHHGQGLHGTGVDRRASLPDSARYRLVQDRRRAQGARPLPEPLLRDRQRHGGGARCAAGRGSPRHPPRHAARVRERSGADGDGRLPRQGPQGAGQGGASAGHRRSDRHARRTHPPARCRRDRHRQRLLREFQRPDERVLRPVAARELRG